MAGVGRAAGYVFLANVCHRRCAAPVIQFSSSLVVPSPSPSPTTGGAHKHTHVGVILAVVFIFGVELLCAWMGMEYSVSDAGA